jgi:hypothetical protein
MSKIISYVATPRWALNIYVSIHSLVASNSSFDGIKVFSVGGSMDRLKSLDIEVEIDEVKNIDKKMFMKNKTYITKIKSEKLVYMDSDTIVINSIDKMSSTEGNLLARPDSSFESSKYFEHKKWNKLLKKYGSKKGPYLNAGFLAFRNMSHRNISGVWKKICDEEYKKGKKSELSKLQGKEMIEQMSLSISILREIEDIGVMSEKQHAYGWEVSPGELDEETIVYHTGSRGGRHLKYAMALDRRGLVDFSEPVISSAAHPLFLKLQAYSIAYRVKEFLSGLRS